LLLDPDGGGQAVVLGPELEAGQHVQLAVPRGVWQGSRLRPGGRCALLGTTMAPGFDVHDYEGGVRAELVARYPAFAERIRALTRA
jgi:predicted cupin superfamily sugar epimerase